MNVLRGWVNKFISAQAIRSVDERSFWANKISLDAKELIAAIPMQKEYKEANKFMVQYFTMFTGITVM